MENFRPITMPPEVTVDALAHKLKSSLAAITMNIDFALDELPRDLAHGEVRDALADCRAAGARILLVLGELVRAVPNDD